MDFVSLPVSTASKALKQRVQSNPQYPIDSNDATDAIAYWLCKDLVCLFSVQFLTSEVRVEVDMLIHHIYADVCNISDGKIWVKIRKQMQSHYSSLVGKKWKKNVAWFKHIIEEARFVLDMMQAESVSAHYAIRAFVACKWVVKVYRNMPCCAMHLL